jgi:hypothetical protein
MIGYNLYKDDHVSFQNCKHHILFEHSGSVFHGKQNPEWASTYIPIPAPMQHTKMQAYS